MSNLKRAAFIVLICILGFSFTRVAHAQNGAPSCEVVQYSTPLSALPLNGNRTQLMPNGSITPGKNYYYSFNVHSAAGVTNHIRAIYMQTVQGGNEPLGILGFRFIGGPCTIDGDKRISCANVNYQYTGDASEVIDVLVRPFTAASPYSSVMFSAFTDQGTATCTSMNPLVALMPTPSVAPSSSFVVTNLKVLGYRSVLGAESNYKEAVLSWSKASGAKHYQLWRMNTPTPYSVGSTSDTTYAVRFLPDTTWDIAVYATDETWARGPASETVHVAYPGQDTLPAVPTSNSTPNPTFLNAPQTFHLVRFQPASPEQTGSAMNAVVQWTPVTGSSLYQIERQSLSDTFVWTGDSTQALVPGNPGDVTYVNVFAQTGAGVSSPRSGTLKLEFPTQMNPNMTAYPSAAPLRTPTPTPFDSSKVAVLEDKIQTLQQDLQAQQQLNQQQSQQIQETQSLLGRIRALLARWFRI